MSDDPIRRSEWAAVLAGCGAASIAAIAWSWRDGAMLNYGDAVAHLHIARRIFDSHRPGLEQLGSVWLPLPHLLLVPFVAVYAWWANGFAGVIPSALAYVFSCAGIYRLARRWLGRAESALALAFLALNPNLLYMQTTAMTEPLFVCEMIWAVVWLVEWSGCFDPEFDDPDEAGASGAQKDPETGDSRVALKGQGISRAGQSPSDLNSERASAREKPDSGYSSANSRANRLLWKIAAVLIAAVFTRYDGWAMALLAWTGIGVALVRHGELRSRAFWWASVLLAAAPIVWFVYNAAVFGDWLTFARGPYSAKAIELRTAPGWPPHPGWHNPWVGLLFFVKVSEMDAVAAAWGNVVLALCVPGMAWGWLIARTRGFLWTLLLWLPAPFYAYAVAFASVPIFIPPWWPHSWYNTRYGLELLPALALGLGCAAHLALAVVRAFRPRWLAAAAALLLALAGLNAWQVLREHPLCYVEGEKNYAARRQYEQVIPAALRALLAARPGGMVLMDTSRYPQIVALTGIPLRQTINESDKEFYRAALASPSGHAALVLAFDGDEIAEAVKRHPDGLSEAVRFRAPGQPSGTLYVSDTPVSTSAPAR